MEGATMNDDEWFKEDVSGEEGEISGEEGEVSGEEEEVSGELDSNRRRRPQTSNETPSAVTDIAAGEAVFNGEDERSGSRDEDEDTDSHSSDTDSHSSDDAPLTKNTPLLAAEKANENGNPALPELSNDPRSISEEEKSPNSYQINLEKEPNLHIDSIEKVGDEVLAATDPESHVSKHNGLENTCTSEVSELDLENVLLADLANDPRDVSEEGEGSNPYQINLEKEPNLPIDSIEKVDDEILTGTDLETQVPKHNGVAKSNSRTLEVSELDLEKVLLGVLPNDSISVSEKGESSNSYQINQEKEPNLHIDSIEKAGDEIFSTIEFDETHVPKHNEVANTYALELSELDIEKVLEEQETHDLFCPHCHSCITKRVVLRKRKRRIQDFRFEERPEKLRVRPDIAVEPAEIVEERRESEPCLFRCLSCFSFFIPTENGFNIFQIFRKKKENLNLQVPSIQSSVQTTARDGNWLFSIFKSQSSKNKGDEAGPLLPQLEVSFGGDHDVEVRQSITVSPAPVAALVPVPDALVPAPVPVPASIPADVPEDESYVTNIQISSGHLPSQLDVLFGGDHDLDTHQTFKVSSVSAPAQMDDNYSTNIQINSAQLPVEFKFSTGDSSLPLSHADMAGESYSTNLKFTSDGISIIPATMSKQPISKGIDLIDRDILGVKSLSTIQLPADDDMIKPIVAVDPSSSSSQVASHTDLSISFSSAQPQQTLLPHGEVHVHVGDQRLVESGRRVNEWEVLKSIVYGGMIESITSLGVVSSAAGAETSTLNIVAIGMANLISGFFVLLHDLSDLKSLASNKEDERSGRYWKLLGRRSNFGLHATVAILSYILFGLLPPVVYGFSFRLADDKERKLIAVASSSLLCIALLAIGKAHATEAKPYLKTLVYYLILGFTVSGLSYVAGAMVDRFFEQLGLFEHNAAPPSPLPASQPPPLPFISFFGVSSGAISVG